MKLKKNFYVALIFLLAAELSTSVVAKPLTTNGNPYQAKVTYTEHGIPHIIADDYGSLGYAMGYTSAADHACNIAYAIMVAQGNSASYLGAGKGNRYVISDTVVKAMGYPDRAADAFKSLRKDTQKAYVGYADGFNRYLSEKGTQNTWCEGKSWVKSITATELFARSYHLSQTISVFAGAIYLAQPPAKDTDAKKTAQLTNHFWAQENHTFQINDLGSNAWAIGKDLTESGKGMLLANPHYPWFGTNRFWEVHLTIPDKLDVYGASLLGVPMVLIGFNKDIAWSHTVSKSQRVAFYELQLVDGKPTQYVFDGKPKDMLSKTVSVDVLNDKGELSQQSRTVWFSHQGPLLQLPNLQWGNKKAYVARDANIDNFRSPEQWFDMAKARSLKTFIGAHKKWNAMPWVNTLVTSRDGEVAYLDNSTVGNLSDKAWTQWNKQYNENPLIKTLYDKENLTLLDGSNSLFDWLESKRSSIPGTTSFEQRPQVIRNDYVFNANDSYWLPNTNQPLTGYSPLYGPTEASISLRSRMNIRHLESSEARGSDNKFSLAEMQQALYTNQSTAKDIFLEDLVAACKTKSQVELDNQTIDIKNVCQEISKFDGLFNNNSKGAVLFREWLQAYHMLIKRDKLELFAKPFDVKDPVYTPSGLGDKNAALVALALAESQLKKVDLPLNATLEQAQILYKNDKRVPIHGGTEIEGVANFVSTGIVDSTEPHEIGKATEKWSILTDKGYLIAKGGSFILALEYKDDGPVAEAIMTYSQSGRADSEFYADQTYLYSDKKWRPVRFHQKDIEEHKVKSFVLK
ncbi:penicillin acylase family protein [Sessilibacter corallicola]|uniref:N-acyl homoserine lactone acylase QqaR n=1 Tax=Sessilibacter corallicola TaxID=2904075 RepID=A0ABQ0ACS7_9GAMM